MFIHNLDPILWSIDLPFGTFALRYYSLAYMLPLLLVYPWILYANKKNWLNLGHKQIDTLILTLGLGTILGGRLGYVLFYEPSLLFSIDAFKIWQGGMSFHGGLIGIFIAALIFSRLNKINILSLADILMLPATIGLVLGRLANFINGELVGTVTSVPWCVVFPKIDELCRHPSQLYEAAYSLLLVGTSTFLMFKQYKRGTTFAWFLIGYGVLRFVVNFVRDDPTLILGITTGQLLSLATAVAGGILLWAILKDKLPSLLKEY